MKFGQNLPRGSKQRAGHRAPSGVGIAGRFVTGEAPAPSPVPSFARDTFASASGPTGPSSTPARMGASA